MSGTAIYYHNVANVDKAALEISNSGTVRYADVGMLKKSGAYPYNFGCFEKNGMRAGRQYNFYDSTNKVGFMSNSISDENGSFTTAPYITVTIGSKITTSGITLYFSETDEDKYCSKVRITWYLADGKTTQKTFYPDFCWYFCENHIENYVKIKIEFLQTATPYNHARLYRLELGEIIIFSGAEDNLVTAKLRCVANLIADEIELNSSSFEVFGLSSFGFAKRQRYDIRHNGKQLSTHYTDGIIQKGSRFTLSGTDMLGNCDEYIPEYNGFYSMTLWAWIDKFIYENGDSSAVTITIDETLKNVVINGWVKERIMKRTLIQKLCFAAGAYVDTVSSDVIAIKSTSLAFGRSAVAVTDETQIFSGDSTEVKQAYKYLIIRYKGADEVEHMMSVTNPNAGESSATKDFTVDLYPNDVAKLLNTYKQYYFNSTFYKAKAVVGYESVGNKTYMDEKYVFILARDYNLDGEKLIAEGEYKWVSD